jgi:hypothetical protein
MGGARRKTDGRLGVQAKAVTLATSCHVRKVGEDMLIRSRLHAKITPEPGASIRVSGAVRLMQ